MKLIEEVKENSVNYLRKRVELGKCLIKKSVYFFVVLTIGVCLGMGMLLSVIRDKDESNDIMSSLGEKIIVEDTQLKIDNVKEILLPASKLITSEFSYTDSATFENYKTIWGKRVPLTTDKVVFIYNGTISMGVSFADVKYDIDNKRKIIYIELPELTIMSNDIDEETIEYPYVSDSIFTATKMEDYTKLLDEIKTEKGQRILADSVYQEQVRRNTERIMEDFLTESDLTKEYKVIFKW